MRELDLTVVSPTSKDMLPKESIEKPLLKIGLNEDYDLKGKQENNLIEDVVIVRQNENKVVETIIVTIEEDNVDQVNVSPRSSRSSSLNSDFKPTRNGPGYERNLLKKRSTLGVPENNNVDNNDELKLDEETRLKILDYKSDNEKPGTIRKVSINERLRNLTRDKSMKKLIKSPKVTRKVHSSKYSDSYVSSSAETSATPEVEKRKKRKLSLGKRRKQSKPQSEPENSEEGSLKRERSSSIKHRRRQRILKSKSDPSLSSYSVNKSKLVLLYSGDSPIKTEIHRNDRLGALKNRYSMESSSEYDEYSSDNNNIPLPKSRKTKRGFAKKVWKSINSLFLADDQSKSIFTTPPLLRRYSTRSYKKKFRSMPGGLDRSKSFSGEKNTNVIKLEGTTFNDSESKSKDSSHLSLMDENGNKVELKEETLPEESSLDYLDNTGFNKERSKSMDVLFDQINLRKNSIVTNAWFHQRKRSNTVLTPREYENRELHYKIMLSQEPEMVQPRNGTIIKSIKNLTYHNAESLITAPKESLKQANDRHNEYVKIKLQNLKVSSQKEMENFLLDKRFSSKQVNSWCRSLSESVKERVMQITADNYKVVVQVFIGALCDDGIHAAVQCTSEDDENKETNENFFTVTYKGKDLFAVASVLTFEL